MGGLLLDALRDRLRARARETADRRFSLLLFRLAFGANAILAAADVRNGFRRRLPLRRDFLPARRARTACMTPPCFLTARCQAVSFRPRRPRRVFRPGLSVAMRNPGIIEQPS